MTTLMNIEHPLSNDQGIARNIVAQKQFADIANEFLKRKINFMPLKGIALLDTLYTDIRERFLSDIDLLVMPKDLPRIHSIMTELGYATVESTPLCWVPNGWTGLSIDLHDGIWYMTADEQKNLWSSSPIVPIARCPCRVFPKEEMIIYAIAHAFIHHGHEKGMWEDDVARMFNVWENKLDVAVLIEQCRQYGLITPFIRAFEIIKSNIPEQTERAIAWEIKRDTNVFEIKILKRLLATEHHLKGHMLRFVFQRNIYHKLTFILRSLFPDVYFMKRRYDLNSTGQVIVAYACRPFWYMLYAIKVVKRMLF